MIPLQLTSIELGIAIICLLLIGIFLKAPLIYLKSLVARQAPLIKTYWLFVIPFVLILILVYGWVWRHAYSDASIAIVGQLSALTFAIFVGYISFSEVGERKFEKLYNDGSANMVRGQLMTALAQLGEAHRIKPKDLSCLSNLLELELLLGRFPEFDAKIARHSKLCVDNRGKLTSLYLIVLRNLLAGNVDKKPLKNLTEFVEEHEGIRKGYNWEFVSLQESDAYQELVPASKKLLGLVIAYLSNRAGDQAIDNGLRKEVGLPVNPTTS